MCQDRLMDEQRHEHSALRRQISRTAVSVSVALMALVSTCALADPARADDARPSRGATRLSRSILSIRHEALVGSLGLSGNAAAVDEARSPAPIADPPA